MHASKVAEESLSEALPLLTGGKDSCFKNYILKVASPTTETTRNIRTTMTIYNAIVAEHKECYTSCVLECLFNTI